MAALETRARTNGIVIERLSGEDARTLEPNINAVGALLSPTTGIVDYAVVALKMAELFVARGGTIRLNTPVTGGQETPQGITLHTPQGTVSLGKAVFCGGLQADRLAKRFGAQIDFRIIPFRGDYYAIRNQPADLVSRLIYPIPDPERPFLGVHLTRKLNGGFTVGPSAVLAFKREGYAKTDISLRDLADSLGYPGFWKLLARNAASAVDELSSAALRRFYLKKGAEILPPDHAGRSGPLQGRGEGAGGGPRRAADRRFSVRADPPRAACLQCAIACRHLVAAHRRPHCRDPVDRCQLMSGARTLLAAFVLAGLAAVLAYGVARQAALRDLDRRLEQSLILTARAVETEIARFRPLPAVAAEDARILAAIRTASDAGAIATANRYLANIARHSGADQLFLLDATGRTIAASNHAEPSSFVGQDYSFRPYFRTALADGRGRFYAIGVTTGKPGYFLSTRVDAGDGVGVLVVKVDLAPLQATWASAGQAMALADADGVVFLASAADWLYRPLSALTPGALDRLRLTRTYDGIALDRAAPLLNGPDLTTPAMRGQTRSGPLRARIAPIATEGWQLLAAAPQGTATSAALASGLGAALLALLATGLAKIAHQRRQLVQFRLAQNTLLEARVADRTRDLAREVQARRQTEAELRAAQDGLIHSEKMAALGRMSAAIVHEISQPLAAMEATLAAAELTLPATEARTLTRIATARGLVRRMQRTTKHLKSFSRKEQGELALIDLAQVVAAALELVAPRARTAGVQPVAHLPDQALTVRAGAVRMEQVLVNLLLNALDAVQGLPGAQVTLTATIEAASADGQRGDHAGDVRISVRDTGVGIAPETLARVTEPFFTTKTGAEGLGLGLSISQAILRGIRRPDGGRVGPWGGHHGQRLAAAGPRRAAKGRGCRMTVFVVDDDADHLAALVDLLDAAGHQARGFLAASEALLAAAATPPQALITDLRMPGMDGFALLEAIRDRGWDLPTLLLTGHGDVAHAVRAMKAGAKDFLEKPYNSHHLLTILARVLRARATRDELGRLQTAQAAPSDRLLGESPALTALRGKIAALGPLDVDVVLVGETGTGKELAARALHAASPRAPGPYVALNCAALPEALFEIEVFGHAAGAFAGAVEKPGKLEVAAGGTLVLDEVEAMPLPLQAKLLRALQERQVERLGEHRLRPLNLRIIATSKTDLRALVAAGAFRGDLFYRLAGAELALPPLRALGQDIPLIFAHYASLAARRYGRDLPQDVDFALRRSLMRHDWPGNMRELKAAAERFALGLDPAPQPRDLAGATLADRVAAYEAREIEAALHRARGSTDRAAQDLGLPRRTLADKIARLGLRQQTGGP